MKKRILCMLLALILVAGVVPTAAISASAASTTISEKAITVLKQLHDYRRTCYKRGNQYYIGYGTLCTDKDHKKTGNTKTHDIKEVDADKALREELKDINSAAAGFASSNGLSLNQGQFDALAIYSFRNGTAWLKGTGVFKTVIATKGSSTNKILNAFVASSGDGYGKQLANMYLHGTYSSTSGGPFKQMTFKVNGGYMPQGAETTYYYDTTVEDYDLPTPTKGGDVFKGWYTKDGKGERVIVLDRFTNVSEVTAVWQSGSNSTDVSYTVSTSRISPWAVYASDRKTSIDDTTLIKDKKTVEVDQDYLDSEGRLWCRLKGTDNWIRLTKSGEAPSGGALIDVTVTVTNSYVNMRSKGSIYSTKIGTCNQGDKLRIIATKDSSESILWGQVAKSESDDTPIGWVALMYTNWDQVKAGSDNIKTDVPANALAKAVVQCKNYVNVRSGAGTNYKPTGALANGTWVYIYEFKTASGYQWGRTDAGWFSLNYAQVTMLKDNTVISTDPSMASYAFTAKVPAGVEVRQYADEKSTVLRTTKASDITVIRLKASTKSDWEVPLWCYIGDGWIPYSSITNASTSKFLVNKTITSVRNGNGQTSDLVDSLSVGVELLIDNDNLYLDYNGDKTTVWGYTAKYDGFVNLSSDYVSRTNAPEIKDDKTPAATYEIGTVKGTDAVNVREKASLYCRVVGKLPRGTEVKILGWSDNGKWAKVDTDLENRGKDNWINKDYLDVREGTLDKDKPADSGSSSSGSSGGGTGVVAGTYSGVNVRSTPGTSGTKVGKALPGTIVTITETKMVGSTKWGKMEQGWVSMDYITMLTTDEPANTPDLPEGAITGGSYDEFDSSSTTAIYTGYIKNGGKGISVHKSPEEGAEVVETLYQGDSVTLHELLSVTVTTKKETDKEVADGDENTTTTTKKTTYWGRINGGYILNPEQYIELTPLHEQTYTVTQTDKLNVRESYSTDSDSLFKARKGDKLVVTTLQIVKDKVWGYVRDEDGDEGWARLDYTSEGAIYVNAPADNSTKPTEPVIGDDGNTGDGGFVTNSGGYKYTGTIVRSDGVKIRSSASLNASVTTTLNKGRAVVIYETYNDGERSWGRCDAGWVALYYVDLTPASGSAVDARLIGQENTVIYSDADGSEAVGTYSKNAVVDIYEVVGDMARTDKGWVSTKNLI